MSVDAYSVIEGAPCCVRCGEEFRCGQVYFSALSEGEEDFERLDYCNSCWQEVESDPFFSRWKTRCATEKEPPRVETETVLEFFENLLGAERADREEMQFVLALYLSRRKALKFTGVERRDGREVLVFDRTGGDESYVIDDPDMDEAQIDVATERLRDLFEGRL